MKRSHDKKKAIIDLLDTVRDLEAKVIRAGSLESRLFILETLQADNIPRTLPSHVTTTSATDKSTSSIHSSKQDTNSTHHTTKY